MKQFFIEILITCILFTGIDAIWLMVIMKDHFNELIKKIQHSEMEPNITAAILCYIILVGGLYYFVLMRIKKFNIVDILLLSAPYGMAVYGTYDFTTAAVLKDWDLGTAFMDLAWGAFLCSATSLGVLYYRYHLSGASESDQNMVPNNE
jgi:uncharacterized membrane protein